MAWGDEDGNGRTIRYYCHTCSGMSKEVTQEPLKSCPIPEAVFNDRKLDPSQPILATDITWEEFERWIRSLAKGKSPGPDELTYEMWQEAPKGMRELLWKTANKINRGAEIPQEWEAAYSRLLVKKVGVGFLPRYIL